MDPEIYDKFFMEIQMVMRRSQTAAAGLNGPELLALRRQENAALIDLLEHQRRAMAFAAGEDVKPVVQFGQSVLVGVGVGA